MDHGKTSTAFEIMMRHAESLGANAIIGIRYESTEIYRGFRGVVLWNSGNRGRTERKLIWLILQLQEV